MGPALASDPALVHSPVVDLGTLLPAWSALPFAGILLSIALCPLLVPRLWHHHFGKVSALWALAFASPLIAGLTVLAGAVVWRFGVRHYRSTGS